MRENDIAVIGMSGILPEAGDLHAFYNNLCEGRDSVREIPEERRRYSHLSGTNYQLCGVLDRVDLFDHAFFNISKLEADNMDPQHRIALQLAYGAIEDAGYAVNGFKGSNAGVFVAAVSPAYAGLLNDLENIMLTGVLPANVAGRIAHALDLRGPALAVDTSCSSSLIAIIQACNELILGNADYMLAGGINLKVDFMEKGSDLMGINSSDGKCRAFSNAANGTSWGEGGGMVLLKRYGQAVEDRDNIHAVIRGYACNQDGGRTIAISAPSWEAQADVILRAVEKAGVHPDEVGYIEAHGTGTVIGDPIEIQGLKAAFGKFTGRKQFCAIGSLKTNIGHLNMAAGIAAVLKVILSLKYGKKFPSLHFEAPNPHIDFDNSPFYVNTRLQNWEEKNRYAAVSSFGISGTNGHMIFSAAPAVAYREPASVASPVMLKVSARTKSALNEQISRICNFLKTGEGKLEDIIYTLNTGRDDHRYRIAVWSDSRSGLLSKLQEKLNGLEERPALTAERKLCLLLSPDRLPAENMVTALSGRYEVFRDSYEKCLRYAGGKNMDSRVPVFSFQFAFYQLLLSSGIAIHEILATGTGSLVTAVLSGKKSLGEAVQSLCAPATGTPAFNATNFSAHVRSAVDSKPLLFLEAGPGGMLSDTLAGMEGPGAPVKWLVLREQEPFVALLAALYEEGIGIDWSKLYKPDDGQRLSLPVYPFDPVSCWVSEPAPSIAIDNAPLIAEPAKIAADATPPAPVADPPNGPELTASIANMFREVLKIEQIDLDDNFLDLGMHSLIGVRILNRIEKELGIQEDLDILFDYCTLRELSAYLQEKTGVKQPQISRGISPLPVQDHYEISHAQKRLWMLDKYDREKTILNLPGTYLLEGELDRRSFQRAFERVIQRHEILRTTFVLVDGEVRQKVHPTIDFSIDNIDLRQHKEKDQALAELCRAEAKKVFDLEKGPLLRATLIDTGEHQCVFQLTLHHIISDGWSMEILVKEITTLYGIFSKGGEDMLPPLRIHYKDYAAWRKASLNGEEAARHRQYWTSHLAGPLPVPALATDLPRPAIKTYNGARVNFILEKEMSAGLRSVAKIYEASLFMTLLATVKALLYRCTGQTDIIVGTTVADRNHADLEGQIGFYVNTLVLRTAFDQKEGFTSLLKCVRENVLKAYEHQAYPFDLLVGDLNIHPDPSRSPLFDVLFELLNGDALSTVDEELNDIKVEGYNRTFSMTQYDLSFRFMEFGDNIMLSIEYNTDLFREASIIALREAFAHLVGCILQQPEVPVQDLSLSTTGLSEAEEDPFRAGFSIPGIGQ